MWTVLFQGFALGMATIVPLGPQNVLVMNQGIRRQYHLLIASLCLLSDMVLISAGVFGGSALLSRSPVLLQAVTLAGVAFLSWYGFNAVRHAWRGDEAMADRAGMLPASRGRVVMTMLAVTWLNPHVYLDTLVVLGSLGGQLDPLARRFFAAGSIGASVVWFYGLALLSARLSPWLNRPPVQRGIQLFVGMVMWMVALKLARQSWPLSLLMTYLQ
ncbi:LysE family transporter [Sodalis ligni]|uniref:L-lysine exporter family protein LysE/ArgO n=1 Tax=Sodalis ligni TaxID=2697027 RepID=A0A4R1NCN9_9GAMM|nr:LysE family transporter [Sodalis ligni]TCL04597.1 L-lysine exporter family protein LysE/ArgO [Sodalis ligni]